jgi:hypothetical protein
MWKLTGLFALVLVVGGRAEADDQTDFKVCQSTYALCTTARCTPVAGAKDTVACGCEVKTGYSAGLKPCKEPGKEIVSRYFPLKSYAICTNARAWAWCLDKPCIVNKDDPTKASCACTSVKDQGPYIIITDTLT